MPGAEAALDPLVNWVAQYLIVIARLSFVIFLMPGLGEQAIPARLRTIVLIAIALAFVSSGEVQEIEAVALPDFLGLIAGEILIGFCLGISMRLCIWLLSIVGSIIAQNIGLAQFLGVALEHEAQTITANLLSMAGAALLLTADFHVAAFTALLGLYADMPIGSIGSFEQAFFIDSIYAAFAVALSLAWPFVAVNLIYNICLGFINKALPQLMVAFVGAPFMVGAGLLMLMVSIGTILYVWSENVPRLVGWM